MRSFNKPSEQSARRRTWRWWSVGCCVALILVGSRLVFAQQVGLSENGAQTGHDLQHRVEQLEAEVSELKKLIQERNSSTPHQPETPRSAGWAPASAIPSAMALSSTGGHQQEPGAPPSASLGGEDRKTLDFLRNTTINLGIDGYYAYNFNRPVGRVNLLRAYDVLSNNFSLNQASIIFERAPDLSQGHRFGGRLDLQFGQATDTLPFQCPNPSSEGNHGHIGLQARRWFLDAL